MDQPKPTSDALKIPDPWHVFRRTQEVDSALRINWMRVIAVFVFYAIHWIDYSSSTQTDFQENGFHGNVNLICGSWLFLSLVVFVSYYSHRIPKIAKYFSTGADILLLTAVASSGGKTESPVIVILFLIIASSVMRMSKNLVIVSTLGACISYLILVGVTDRVWFDSNHEVPLSRIAILLASMTLMGIICWHCIHSCEKWFRKRQTGNAA